ncbi:predicted protein [Sclerotinia sclerotiorum 1980 UF-70]|uniref:Uncharacterized protein n=1 Tax=Sclerotinia sclerotiorum (strain ATCC 18683 / 1980 / Ss-1) TaxID=665079 RepID=A7EW56_SCLS1|nr:predicted protein [Sclerotinia sclerotiorum 1980 UF-70]EDN93698.1 predicted protein [Sclerotinia sclerotiorum 1980 UF-70]
MESIKLRSYTSRDLTHDGKTLLQSNGGCVSKRIIHYQKKKEKDLKLGILSEAASNFGNGMKQKKEE